MPRVTPAHEQAVRQRIIDAAITVFGELGFARATIQDVVRASGLSVGAVYTHFRNKEELFFVAAHCEADEQKDELRLRLADIGPLPARLRAAIDWAVDSAIGHERSILLHAFTHADESPELRQMLRDRRTEMVAFSRLVIDEAVARNELPRWIDAEGLASAFVTLVDGLTLRAVEAGSVSSEDARREAYSLLQLLVAAPAEAPAAALALQTAGGTAARAR